MTIIAFKMLMWSAGEMAYKEYSWKVSFWLNTSGIGCWDTILASTLHDRVLDPSQASLQWTTFGAKEMSPPSSIALILQRMIAVVMRLLGRFAQIQVIHGDFLTGPPPPPDKNANFGPNLAVFRGWSKTFGTHISRKQLNTSFVLKILTSEAWIGR